MLDVLFLLLLLPINALFCLGWYNACNYQKPIAGLNYSEIKGLLWFVPYFFEVKFKIHPNNFWLKPIYSCIPCMASIHSILPFWLFHNLNTNNILLYIIYIFALSGLNLIVNQITDVLYKANNKLD